MHPRHDLILLDAVLLYTLDLHDDGVVAGHDYDAQRVADILVVAAAG